MTDEELDRELVRRREMLKERIRWLLQGAEAIQQEMDAIDEAMRPAGRARRGGFRVIDGGRSLPPSTQQQRPAP